MFPSRPGGDQTRPKIKVNIETYAASKYVCLHLGHISLLYYKIVNFNPLTAFDILYIATY